MAAGEWDGLHRRIRVVVVVEPSIRSESEQRKIEREGRWKNREREKRRKEREEILAAVTREDNGNDTWKNGLKIRGWKRVCTCVMTRLNNRRRNGMVQSSCLLPSRGNGLVGQNGATSGDKRWPNPRYCPLGKPRKFLRNSTCWFLAEYTASISSYPLPMNADSDTVRKMHAFMRRCIGLRASRRITRRVDKGSLLQAGWAGRISVVLNCIEYHCRWNYEWYV